MNARLCRVVALALGLGFLEAIPAQNDPEKTSTIRFQAIEKAVIEVVKKIRPSTVAIFALRRVEFEGQKRFVAASGGSGVIVDRSGYIVTNDHVAGHCDAIQVVLEGGRKVPAKLVATDQKGDIALLKIEGNRFPAAELGDSGKVKVGQWVLAVGNPFFLGADGEPVVTLGVGSGKNRVLGGGRWEYTDSIQTDAEINPGNSGGPLFNMKGQLIGINGKIATRQGFRASSGAGYAIPVDVIKSFLPQLRKGKNIERGYSGIVLDDKPTPRGVGIKEVRRGSPADRGNIKNGDLILSVNGKPVNNTREYINLVSKMTAGKFLSLKIRRKGRARSVRLKLEVDPTRKKMDREKSGKKKKER